MRVRWGYRRAGLTDVSVLREDEQGCVRFPEDERIAKVMSESQANPEVHVPVKSV